jgi:hypothetical protein
LSLSPELIVAAIGIRLRRSAETADGGLFARGRAAGFDLAQREDVKTGARVAAMKRPRSVELPMPVAGTLALAAGFASAAFGMAPRLAAILLSGPICSGHGSAWALHCPACYAGAALIAIGLAAIAGAYITRDSSSATSP